MAEITIKREDLDLLTLHDVMKKIKENIELTPEQEFRICALIKRHVHYDKTSVYDRIKWYLKGEPVSENIIEFLNDKVKTHKHYAHAPDEEIVTWSIGSHIYKQ